MVRRSAGWILFWFLIIVAVRGSASAGSSQAQPAGVSSETVRPERVFIDRYCAGCHNEKTKTAGLALDVPQIQNIGDNPQVWEKVVRKLRARMMPPIGRPRPDEVAYNAMISHLEDLLDRGAVANPNPGRTDTFRRLSRTEYQNAIRDLLGLDMDVSPLLPSDDSSFGFDNITVGG